MTTSYLSRLPRVFMRVVAGFPKDSGTYHLKRAIAQPPRSLVEQVWPEAEDAARAYDSHEIQSPDIAGRQQSEMLLELRVVLLQDAALLRPRFPHLAIYHQPVFKSAEWAAFEEIVQRNEAVVEEPLDVRIQIAMPAVAQGLQTIHTSLSGLVKHSTETIGGSITEFKSSVGESLSGIRQQLAAQRPVEGLILVPPSAVTPSYWQGLLANGIASVSPIPSTSCTENPSLRLLSSSN